MAGETEKNVKAHGKGQSAYRVHVGALPSDYWSNPKKYKNKLKDRAKTKVRNLLWSHYQELHGKNASTLKRMGNFDKYMISRVGFS